jgi:hypothetical protein
MGYFSQLFLVKQKKKTHLHKILRLFVLCVYTLQTILIAFPREFGGSSPVQAATHTVTSSVDFANGQYASTESESKEGELKLKADGAWGPKSWKTPNVTLGDQAAIVSDGTYLYVLANADNYFARYSPLENKWKTLSIAPRYAYPGAQLVYLGGYIYAEFGGYQKEFARYNIETNTWENRADMPDLVYGGTSCATDATSIYCLRGTTTSDFWKYNPGTNTWSTMSSPALTIGVGAGLVYYSGNLYALRGANTTTMYRYNIAANTWFTTSTLGPALPVAPGALNEDHTITIKDDEIFVTRDQGTQSFYKYKISTNAWSTLANTPQVTRYVGAVAHSGDGYIYVFRGNSTYEFWKYDPTGDIYLGPTDLPASNANPGTGADLVYKSGYLYYSRGGNQAHYYRYQISTGIWTALTSTTAAFNDEIKGVAAGNYIYYMRGGSTTTFYSYDTVGGAWATLAVTPATIGAGGTLAYPGSGDYIYATRGLTTRSFYRYQISTNTWSDPAVADLPDNAEAAIGARLISDGTDVYAIPGNGMTKLMKYSVAGNSWSEVTDLPFAPYYGTDVSYYGGKLFFQAGYYKSNFYEYTIASNTWRRLADIQSYGPTELGPYNGAALEIDSSTGIAYSLPGQGLLYLHQFTPTAYNYPASGQWTSSTIDLTYVASWTSLTTSSTTPGDSSVTIETRTSADRTTWTSWGTVTGGVIPSAVHRYIQIRTTLSATTDRTQTPIVASLTVNYVGDENAPTNPSSFTGLSQAAGGVSISTGTTYRYQSPYFAWSGATDVESNIAGYYVYFGTDSGADPQTAGSFQTGSTYTVTSNMTQGETYYLRLQTKDVSGNVSNATTGFVYGYIGVSPPQVLTQTTSSDFSGGTASNVSTTGDKIELSSKAGFWQQERLSVAPAAKNYGSDLAYSSSGNKLYMFPGNTTNFYEYDIATDTWTAKATTPAAGYIGGDLVEGSAGYLYAMRGQNTTAFWSYNIGTNTWSDSAVVDAPQNIYYGGSAVFDGDQYIYALKGNSDDTFMRYDTQADSWETLANVDFGAPDLQTNNLVYDGGDLAFDGGNTVYAIQGNTRTGFAAYNVTSNSWSQLPNLPTLAYSGSKIEYDATSNAIYYLAGWGKTLLFKYDIESQTWVSLPDAPASIGAGATMKNVNGILYVLRGGSQTQFYKYNIAKGTWVIPNVGLFGGWFRGSDVRTFSYGADIVKGSGDYYYLTRGNFDNLFVRYDAATGETVKLADAPIGFYVGAELVYLPDVNKIYATANYYYRKFFVYDVASNTWSEETADPPPVDVGEGTNLSYDGSQYIYFIRGASSQSFYRFNRLGSSGSKWSTALSNVPAAAQYGSDSVIKNDYIYALRGNTQLSFYRYGPLSGTPSWNDVAVADLPAGVTIANDGFLVDGGGDLLYACRGANTATCYQYSISGNTWTAIANAPAQITAGGSAVSNGTNKILMIPGAGTNTFANGVYSYIMQTATSSFQESGTYTSAIHDMTSIYKFAQLLITATLPSNTTLASYTRTSANGTDWDDWQQATSEKIVGTSRSYKISSTPKRYIQVKFTLGSGDNIYTPTVNDYTVSYYQDADAPQNPSQITGYTTATMAAAITTNTWYNYSSPHFVWPLEGTTNGATDSANGSGIDGYYVYFGASASADIITEGTYQTGNSYTASSLTAGQTYYLRLKTKDNAGNVSASGWDAFIYKFNDQKPDNPTTLTVDPPGPTNVNSYTFAWSGGTPDVSYCYKTGAIGSVEQCTSNTSVASVSAYQEGNNIFYLRAKDVAGNYATSYATVVYQLLETAPSAPQSLEVTPEHSTSGEFAFSWQPPSFFGGTQAGLKYYYSVNALPTSQNVTLVGSQSYLPSSTYATQVDENTLYVVAKDEVGNISYNSYASVKFYADTSSPGIPTNVDIADLSVKDEEKWRLVVSWDPPTSSGSAGVSYYNVYHTTSTDASCTTDFSSFTKVAETRLTSFVHTDLTQVANYYCITACNVTNQCSAVSTTVDLLPDGKWEIAPTLVSSVSATVKTKSAVIAWSTSRTSNSFVKYGKKSGDYNNESGSSEQVAAHTILLNSLDPGATYYYKVLWTDEDGNTGSSDELSFSTNAAPFVSNVKFSRVNINSAQVTFTIKSAIKASVQYGKTTSYGSVESISTSKSETSYTVEVQNLTEGSAYHLRIAGEDDESNVYYSDDYTFETLPTPKLSNVRIQQVVGMPSATIRVIWSSNTLINSIVTYYPSRVPQQATDSISLSLKKNHEVILNNLLDETDYTILIKGRDSVGNEAKTETRSLKTANDVRPPEVQNLNVESTIIGVGENARAQIVVTWDSDEPSTTQVEYGQGTGSTYNQTTQEDTNKTTNHTVTITGLSPSKIYHLRALSKDKADNLGQSLDTVIITPKSTKDALNLVIENLSKTFGFLKGATILK